MEVHKKITAWKVSKYGVLSGPYFSAFGLNTERLVFRPNAEKYGPEKTPYLDTFHAVSPLIFYYYAKSVRILTFSGLYFPIFGLITEWYLIQSEYGKIRTSNTDTFHVMSTTTLFSIWYIFWCISAFYFSFLLSWRFLDSQMFLVNKCKNLKIKSFGKPHNIDSFLEGGGGEYMLGKGESCCNFSFTQ